MSNRMKEEFFDELAQGIIYGFWIIVILAVLAISFTVILGPSRDRMAVAVILAAPSLVFLMAWAIGRTTEKRRRREDAD